VGVIPILASPLANAVGVSPRHTRIRIDKLLVAVGDAVSVTIDGAYLRVSGVIRFSKLSEEVSSQQNVSKHLVT
jgi:DNA-binding transcriptional ArsR family regulator